MISPKSSTSARVTITGRVVFGQPPDGGGFLTALTVLTRLTVLTADRIGVVANVDDFSEIIYERQSDRNVASGFWLAA
jgi:hypothetical protein